jgi:hypothetical protein
MPPGQRYHLLAVEATPISSKGRSGVAISIIMAPERPACHKSAGGVALRLPACSAGARSVTLPAVRPHGSSCGRQQLAHCDS